jgi:extracellular factor (EF) 3-hydroxypalmitic acid methyl ester biosynthesis protein
MDSISSPTLLQRLFAEAERLVRSNRAIDAFRLLDRPLGDAWFALDASERSGMKARIRASELFNLCLEDPFTRRAFEKPRGYAGDAVMLDYVYAGEAPEGVSAVGRDVFHNTVRSTMGLSVLHRRDLLRAHIDQTVAEVQDYRILSVASGHCRELDGSLVLTRDVPGDFLAFDQDHESCAVVRKDYSSPRVKVMEGGIRNLVKPTFELGKFDFIYSAGLYDYLDTNSAHALTSALINRLQPGGRLIIANYAEGAWGRAYLELFMDWHLIYRSPQEMMMLFDQPERASAYCWTDPHRNVVYVEYVNRNEVVI